jgi:transposase-like protein
MTAHAHLLDEEGRQRLVRHGFLPEREVMTGIGTVPVQVPRVRDRGSNEDGSKIRFRSSLVPPYLRKAKSVEELLPWLYLKGISTGDFSEALAALLGPDAEGLSASTITRLKATWWDEFQTWSKRDLSGKRYVYIWADGVYFTPRLDGDRQCMLVIIGADEYGEKDVLAIMDGFRENADSWRDLLKGLKKRGLTVPPELATGDGALGFWTALRDVFPTTREQRCWVHKTANVLGAMPKSLHEKAKSDLQDIWMAETKKEANAAFDLFVETYGVKYERAVAKLIKDRDVLLTFYDFPAEHWKHIRTTNPIESVFATVRNRTRKTKGCLNRKTALAMVFRLMMSAKKKWRKISGPNRLPEVIQGIAFKDGIKQLQNAA